MKEKEKKPKKPKRLADFKGNPPGVQVVKHAKDQADVLATKVLMDLYSDKDGFHCPRCGVTITDGDKAVIHLAEEINEGLARLGKKP
ncbi:hypothetical protein LCGC14_0921720 [marine sediment metagenome]|uniref:Uncharacterized protein n=1 Tax=marine sediment metagenome TaxID=412755 RepID=A0A0F9PBB3_9ZZZZ